MRISYWSSDWCSSDLLVGITVPKQMQLEGFFGATHRVHSRPDLERRRSLDGPPDRIVIDQDAREVIHEREFGEGDGVAAVSLHQLLDQHQNQMVLMAGDVARGLRQGLERDLPLIEFVGLGGSIAPSLFG